MTLRGEPQCFAATKSDDQLLGKKGEKRIVLWGKRDTVRNNRKEKKSAQRKETGARQNTRVNETSLTAYPDGYRSRRKEVSGSTTKKDGG